MEVIYRSTAHALKVHLGRKEINGIRKNIRVEFENGILRLNDEDLITRMDKSIAGGLGIYVQRVNLDAGVAIAEAHKAQLLKQQQIAKGSTTSGHLLHEVAKAGETALEKALRDPTQQTPVNSDAKELRELPITEHVDPPAGAADITKIEPEPKNTEPQSGGLSDLVK